MKKAVLIVITVLGGFGNYWPIYAEPTEEPNQKENVAHAEKNPTPPPAHWYAEAQRFLQLHNYAEALPFLKRAAVAGNLDAMRDLGYLYTHEQHFISGGSIIQDYSQGRQWYQKAAAGDTIAMNDLGGIYEGGLE